MDVSDAVMVFSEGLDWDTSDHPVEMLPQVVAHCAERLRAAPGPLSRLTCVFLGTGFSPASEVATVRCLQEALSADESAHMDVDLHLVDIAYKDKSRTAELRERIAVLLEDYVQTRVHLHPSVTDLTRFLSDNDGVVVDVFGCFNFNAVYFDNSPDKAARDLSFAIQEWNWKTDLFVLATHLLASNPNIISFESQGRTCRDVFVPDVLRSYVGEDVIRSLIAKHPVLGELA